MFQGRLFCLCKVLFASVVSASSLTLASMVSCGLHYILKMSLITVLNYSFQNHNWSVKYLIRGLGDKRMEELGFQRPPGYSSLPEACRGPLCQWPEEEVLRLCQGLQALAPGRSWGQRLSPPRILQATRLNGNQLWPCLPRRAQ